MGVSRLQPALALTLLLGCAVDPGGNTAGAGAGDGPAAERVDARDPRPAFASAETCAVCHSAAPGAEAMRTRDGADVSPHRLWSATPMAHAALDPFWRAQVAAEVAAAPERAAELEALCTRCHAPVAQREAAARGREPLGLAEVEAHALGREGVTCTFCHQILPDGLGTEATFSGFARLGTERQIFGPYESPFAMPMRMRSGFTPVHGAHVRDAGLCGTCHTLFTQHAPAAGAFPEQTPYLEWLASSYADGSGGVEARTCQQCHMPSQGSLRIARNPGGRDFPPVRPRPDYAAHRLVGGNARLLDLLAANAAQLGVTADPRVLAESAASARDQLARATARVEIGPLRREGRGLAFEVRVENLAGHKFPTGYPARRAWLEVEVRDGERTLFHLGRFDARGRLVDAQDERALPHRATVEREQDLVVYELVAHDERGVPTTLLARMARVGKDTRLLPRGWRAQGPHAAATSPVGVGGDPDFGPGGDTVTFRVPLPDDAGAPLAVRARLRFQTMPPAWIDALRGVDAEAARRFVRMHDALPGEPEVAGSAERSEG
jgi:hypothetical protein